jgi:predicted dehydrogenase
MNKIKTAVIGVGHLGKHHARWYRQIPESELIGVYDIDSEKSERIASEWKVSSFASIDEMIGKVDAVSVAVTTAHHFDVAVEIIKNKIHCLIEKPIAATYDEAIKLVELARENNVILAVGHIERFNPAIKALKKFNIAPRFIEAHRLAAFDPRGTDVAVILDLMIHDIELTLHLVASPIKNIEASAVSAISDTADIANARLTFANGAVANLTSSRISLRPMRKLRLFQKSGYFSLDLATKQADIYRLADNDNSTEGMRIPLGKSGHDILYNSVGSGESDMLCDELTDFLRAINMGHRPEVTGDDAAEALRVAIEIEKIGLAGTVA